VLTLRYGYNHSRMIAKLQSEGFDLATLGFDSSYAGAVPGEAVPRICL